MKTIILFVICLLISSVASASEVPTGGQISGIVKDKIDNIPISGVKAELFLDDALNPIKTKFTNSEGVYAFDGLALGTYKLKFTKERLITVWLENSANKKLAKPIIISSPEITTNVDVVMEVGGTITGKITDLNGQPLAFISTELISYRGDGIGYQRSSDRQGKYFFTGLPSGKYSLRFLQADKSYVWYGGQSHKMVVTAPETISGIDASLIGK